MKKKLGWLLFTAAIFVYAFLYLATEPIGRIYPCEGDCAKAQTLDSLLTKNHHYIYHVGVGGYRFSYDTLNVNLHDTSGINWNLLADTVCSLASGLGLIHRYIYVLKEDTINHRYDTMSSKQCP